MLNVDQKTYEWLRDERRAVRQAMRQPGLTPREQEECEERLSTSRGHVGIAQALADNEREMLLDEIEQLAAKESQQRSWAWYAAVAVLGFVIYRTLKWALKG